MFQTSRSISRPYARPESVPQFQAWLRMRERGDPGLPPVGARMPYVIIAPPSGVRLKIGRTKITPAGGAIYSRTEHPTYAEKAGLQLDTAYYINSFRNPLSKMLRYVDGVGVDQMVDAALRHVAAVAQHKRTRSLYSSISGAGPRSLVDSLVRLYSTGQMRPPRGKKRTRTGGLLQFMTRK